MVRILAFGVGLGLVALSTGCSESCESIQQEIQEVGQEIRSNPGSAMDRAEELEQLRNKYQEMGCAG